VEGPTGVATGWACLANGAGGSLPCGVATLVCASIPVGDPEVAAADAVVAKGEGADLVEFRVDEYFHGDTDTNAAENQSRHLAKLVSESPLPCIVTCRHVSEGGHYDGPEDARISLLEHLTRAGAKGHNPPRYIDVELASYQRSRNLQQKVGLALNIPGGIGDPAPDAATSLILSLHDTKARPHDLHRQLSRLYETPAASIVKVAYRARSLRDSLELLDLHEHALKPTIALGMGEYGLITRVLAAKFGGFLTFASLRRADATAPGQPTVAELLDLYRFRSINRATSVYGVIGHPVSHSMSPLVHNAAFGAASINSVYLPLPIAADADEAANDLSLKATLLELLHHPRLDLRGLSITIPFKSSILRLGRAQGWTIDPAAAAIGAANTLVRNGDSITLLNTDAPGAIGAMEESVGSLSGKHIAILGAGGVARAIAFACAGLAAAITFYVRNEEQATALAGELNHACPNARATVLPLSEAATTTADIIINGTPVGMQSGSHPGQSPIPDLSGLKPTATIFDTVYNPIETPLLKAARSRGLATIDGVSLFTRQAEAQFKLWTGLFPQQGLFDRLVRDHLARQEA